ncbi:MAG: sulfatase [Myxococcales bacterium]|nr:sulfatase [Myxococcales bacterium]
MFRRWLESPWPYFVGAGILLVIAVASQFEVQLPSRSRESVEAIAALKERDDVNVVFVLIDTLRADRLGAYGYERPTSPTLDDLAKHGIRFGRVLSQSSWTKTSMASLWTGTLPANNGLLRYNHVVPEEATLPAEVFQAAGFRTAGIWRNGWVAPNFGFAQGFEVYMRPKAGRERAQIQRANPSSHPLLGSDEDLIQSAAAFLDNFGRERFFLYLHFMDAHQYLYDASSAQFGTSYSDVYDQSVLWTDRLLASLVEKLESLDLLDETVIAIASDHGEAFREHGREGHAKNLYIEVADVPFVISLPFLLDPGIVVEETVANVDIWPTLFDLVGLPPLPGADGVSVLPLVMAAGGLEGAEGAESLANRTIFAQLDRFWGNPKMPSYPIVSVTDDAWRLMLHVNNPKGLELFDRTADPEDASNLIAEGDGVPEPVARLKAKADEYLANAESPWGVAPPEVELDEMKLEQLRALGYVIKK